MQDQSLLGALPILAKFLGRKLGVNVVFGATQAKTDGRTIYLPDLPNDDIARVLANGYIDHEGAHIRYTDFAVPQLPTPLGYSLQNLLEDIRIERALGQALPGCQKNLAQLNGYLVDAGELRLPPLDAPPAQWVLAYLSKRLSADVLQYAAVRPLANVAEAQVRSLLPVGAMVKLNALAFSVTQARNTQEVTTLCQRILHMLEEESQPPESPPDRNTGDGPSGGVPDGAASPAADQGSLEDGRQSNDLEASDNGSGQLTNAAAEGNQPALDDTGSECANASLADGSNQPLNPSGASGSGAGDAGTGDVLRQILAASAEDLAFPMIDRGQHLQSLLDKTSRATRKPLVIAEPDPVPHGQANAPVLAKARSATAALRRRLAVLVQASREEVCWRSPRGHRLSGRDLYRLTCREPGIFRRQERHEAPNTAVLILLDRSGSMEKKMHVANQATLATAVALQEIEGCTAAVGAFPGSQRDRVIPLLDFGEQAQHVAGRFMIHADGGTPLAPALLWAGYSLLLQPEPRRLLLVITDGQPSECDAVQRAINRCRASGIEVMGLGIQAQFAVEDVFGKREAANIDDITELAPRLFRLLEQRLTQHAA